MLNFLSRCEGSHINKRIQLIGGGFVKGSLMMWDGNKEEGNWIVKSWPQYALATPKGDRHIWYRGSFQFELNNGNFYSGYWEMDIHFRYIIKILIELIIIKNALTKVIGKKWFPNH